VRAAPPANIARTTPTSAKPRIGAYAVRGKNACRKISTNRAALSAAGSGPCIADFAVTLCGIGVPYTA